VKDLLIGRKAIRGPFKGSYRRYKGRAGDLKSWKGLSRSKANEMLADPEKRKLVRMINLDGKKVPAMRKQTVGGLAGFAHKHPVGVGGGVAAAYMLNKSRKQVGQQYTPQQQAQIAAMRRQQAQARGGYSPLPSEQGGF